MESNSISTNWTVNYQIHIDTTSAIVWEILTNPKYIKQWMWEEEIIVESDWKVNSTIRFEGLLNGLPFKNKGIILQFEPEKFFQYSFWSTLSEQEDKPKNYSIITFTLTPIERKTMLTFTQRNFIAETTFKHSDLYWKGTLQIIKQIAESTDQISTNQF